MINSEACHSYSGKLNRSGIGGRSSIRGEVWSVSLQLSVLGVGQIISLNSHPGFDIAMCYIPFKSTLNRKIFLVVQQKKACGRNENCDPQ